MTAYLRVLYLTNSISSVTTSCGFKIDNILLTIFAFCWVLNQLRPVASFFKSCSLIEDGFLSAVFALGLLPDIFPFLLIFAILNLLAEFFIYLWPLVFHKVTLIKSGWIYLWFFEVFGCLFLLEDDFRLLLLPILDVLLFFESLLPAVQSFIWRRICFWKIR